MLRLDRTLADFLAYIDDKVGLEHTVIAFSADHGMAEMPEYSAGMGQSVGRIYSDQLLAMAREQARTEFGSDALVKDFFRPYLYLDHQAIAGRGLDAARVAAFLAGQLERLPGIGGAIPRAQATGNRAIPGTGLAAVQANHHPSRSGDICVYQQPYWFLFDRGPIGVMHGSPWAYDQHVPIIFAGAGIQPRVVVRPVHPIDVAPTLSALLGYHPPAGAQGSALPEVVAL